MDKKDNIIFDEDKTVQNKYIKFVEILKVRFWDIAKHNLLCLAVYAIFIFVYTFFVTQIFFPIDLSDYMQGYTNYGELFAVLIYRIPYTLVAFAIPVMAFGPMAAAMAAVYRSYVRREDSFSSDLFDAFKKFFWKALGISSISTIITICLGIAYMFYQINLEESFIKTALLLLILAFTVIFIMAHLYVYQVLVEYDLPIWKLYRYSFVFAILRFFPNLLIVAGIATVVILPFYIHILFGAVVMLLFIFSFSAYLINFFTWPALEKHLDPIMKEEKIKKVKLF